jgi:hypothetical protein
MWKRTEGNPKKHAATLYCAASFLDSQAHFLYISSHKKNKFLSLVEMSILSVDSKTVFPSAIVFQQPVKTKSGGRYEHGR